MPNRKPTSPEDPAVTSTHGGDFVERMFSGIGHDFEVPIVHPRRPPQEEPYRPLRQSTATRGITYRLQSPTAALRVQASSPATDVMTDLSKVKAVTTAAAASVDEAHEAMIKHGVRALFVVDESGIVLGIVTASTIFLAKDRFRSRRTEACGTSTFS
jgi:CBS domain-containing protein